MIKYSSCSNHLWFLPCCHQNNILLRDLHVKSRIKSEKNPLILLHTAVKAVAYEYLKIELQEGSAVGLNFESSLYFFNVSKA